MDLPQHRPGTLRKKVIAADGCDDVDDDGDDGMSGLLLFAMGRTCCCCIVLGNSEISDDLALSWDDR